MLLHWTLDHFEQGFAAFLSTNGQSFEQLGKQGGKSFVGSWDSSGRMYFDYLIGCSCDIDLHFASFVEWAVKQS